MRSDNTARASISDAEYHAATALVRDGNAILHQIAETETILRLLELKSFILGTNHEKGVDVRSSH